MKKVTFVSLLCLVMFFATGCKKFSYDVKIDKNDNIVISETEAVNLSAVESMPDVGDRVKSKLDEVSAKLMADGAVVKDYNDGVYRGITRSKKPVNIADSKKGDMPVGFTVLQAQPVVVETAFLKNRYSIKWAYDMNKAMEAFDKTLDYNPTSTATTENTDSSGMELTQDEEIMKNAFSAVVEPISELTITIPYRAVSHNAKSVSMKDDNYVYKWDLASSDDVVNIELVYEKVEFVGSAMVISFILLFIGLVVVMIKMKEESSF